MVKLVFINISCLHCMLNGKVDIHRNNFRTILNTCGSSRHIWAVKTVSMVLVLALSISLCFQIENGSAPYLDWIGSIIPSKTSWYSTDLSVITALHTMMTVRLL